MLLKNICLGLLLLLGVVGQAQVFLDLHGDANENTAYQVQYHDDHLYTLESFGSGTTSRSLFVKYDLNGNVIWRVNFGRSISINDFATDGNSNFMLVGHTLPYTTGKDNKSVLAQINDLGNTYSLVCYRYFDQGSDMLTSNKRERFDQVEYREKEGDYLVLGRDADISLKGEALYLYTTTNNCTLLTKRNYRHSVNDQFHQALVAEEDGGWTMMGSNAARKGAYITLNDDLSVKAAYEFDTPSAKGTQFRDAVVDETEKIFVGRTTVDGSQFKGLIAEVSNGVVNWALEVPEATTLYQIEGPYEVNTFNGKSFDYFVLGLADVGNIRRRVLYRFRSIDSNGGGIGSRSVPEPTLLWAKYLDQGENAYSDADICLYERPSSIPVFPVPTYLAYVDGRTGNPNGFGSSISLSGSSDALVGSFDLEFSSCMTLAARHSAVQTKLSLSSVDVTETRGLLPTSQTATTQKLPSLMQASPCGKEPCTPTIICPDNISVVLPCNSTDNCGIATFNPPTVTDDCPVTQISCDFNSGDCFPIGTTTVTCTATTEEGITNECTFTVTVERKEDPLFVNCPRVAPIEVIASDPDCKAIVPDVTDIPIISGGCGQVTVTQNPAAGTMVMNDLTIVVTVTDESGASFICEVSLVVIRDGCDKDTIKCGMSVATCYTDPIVGGGPVAVIYDTRFNSSAPVGADWNNSGLGTGKVEDIHPPSWDFDSIGQVFGIAIDNTVGDIFLAATDIYPYFGTSNTTGPAGTAGIYRTLGSDLNNTSIFINTSNIPSSPCNLIGGSTIPNMGGINNGIGNIAYDQYNDQLFATNLEDGRIYRIGMSGNILSIYDPFNTSADVQGMVAINERIWGIGIFEENGTVKVYFASEGSNLNGAEVWSIPLLPSGEFQGTPNSSCIIQNIETLEVILPLGGQRRATDISFSTSCKMLVAERGNPHDAHVYEYNLINTNWDGPYEYFVGQPINLPHSNSNSAGGVDYGYVESSGNTTFGCDSMVWMTGNYMMTQSNQRVYGLEGVKKGCNDPITNGSTDLYIDFDQVYNTAQKQEIGDVEVFRCVDCPKKNINCDDLMVMAEVVEGDDMDGLCCYDVDIKNNVGTNITKLEAEVLTPNWQFNQYSLMANGNLSLDGTPTANKFCVRGNNGSIPTMNDAIRFCLDTTATGYALTQQIVFRWYEEISDDCEIVVCTDTITTNCEPRGKIDCVSILESSVECSPNNPYEYTMTFNILNESALDAYQVILQNLSDPNIEFRSCTANGTTTSPAIGVNLDPSPLGAGNTSNSLCVELVSSAPITQPTTVCFTAGLNQLVACCHESEEYCVILEPCCDPCEEVEVIAESISLDEADCCYALDIINECEYDYFTRVETEILTDGVIFGYHQLGGTSANDWVTCSSSQTNICWQPTTGTIPPGTTDDLIQFCLSGINDASQVPQQIAVNFYALGTNGEEILACSKIVEVNCPVETNFECLEISEESIVCIPDSNKYRYTFTVTHQSDVLFAADQLEALIISPSDLQFEPSNIFTFNQPLMKGESATISTCLTGINGFPPTTTELVVNFRLAQSNADSCCYETLFDTIPLPLCETVCCGEDRSLIRNGAFTGLSNGDLPSSSSGADWVSISNSPNLTNRDGCEENGSVTIWGNGVVGEAMQQGNLNIEQGKTYQLSFCARFLPGVKPNEDPFVRFRFRASNSAISGNNACNTNCEIMGESTNITSSEWQTICLPAWTANADFDRITVSIVTDQSLNDGDYVSFGRIDDICLIEVDDDVQDFCPKEDIFITDDLSGVVLEQTKGSLFASSTLSSTSDVEYIAGDTIRLVPGFRATEGITFRAKIGECRLDDIAPLQGEDLEGRNIVQQTGELSLEVAPNPFSISTNIRFYLPESTTATLTVHNVSGQVLTSIQTNGKQQGWQQSTFYPDQLKAGVYYLILKTEMGMKTEKIVVLK